MPTVSTTEPTLDDLEVQQIARDFANSNRSDILFQNKHNRDAVYRRVTKIHRIKCRRRSTGHQLLDPRYTVEGSSIPDKGFGNDYRHSFANLYELSKDRW